MTTSGSSAGSARRPSSATAAAPKGSPQSKVAAAESVYKGVWMVFLSAPAHLSTSLCAPALYSLASVLYCRHSSGGIEALKLAEVLAPRLTKELFSIGYRKRRGLKGPEHAAATALPAWEMSLDESTRRGRIFKSKANSHRSTSTSNEFKTRMSRHELACLDPVSQDKN